MSELIDKEKLLDSVYKNTPLIPSMAGMTAEAMRFKIATLIDNFDSIDLVRCKDCKFQAKCPTKIFGNHLDDWFCADGVRKEQSNG